MSRYFSLSLVCVIALLLAGAGAAQAQQQHAGEPLTVGILLLNTYGSPIFKAVQKKQCKALYRALKKSPKSPEFAVGEGSERSHVDRSVVPPE